MAETVLQHMHNDLELLKKDVSVIKHILYEEGALSDEAIMRLEKARKTPLSKYKKL